MCCAVLGSVVCARHRFVLFLRRAFNERKTRSIAFHLKSSCKCERARHLPALV